MPTFFIPIEDKNNTAYKIFIFGGVVAILLAAYILIKNQEAKNWPTVIGNVISSERFGEGTRHSGSHIRFSYVIKGQAYLSDNVSFFGDNSISNYYKYPLNSSVTVHYNPNNRDEAVLQFKTINSFMGFGMGAVFIFVGFYLKKNPPGGAAKNKPNLS